MFKIKKDRSNQKIKARKEKVNYCHYKWAYNIL